jgi:hypothetical protein
MVDVARAGQAEDRHVSQLPDEHSGQLTRETAGENGVRAEAADYVRATGRGATSDVGARQALRVRRQLALRVPAIHRPPSARDLSQLRDDDLCALIMHFDEQADLARAELARRTGA